MTTLQDAIKIIEYTRQMLKPKTRKRKTNITSQLLGKYKGILPVNKTSTQFIRELRDSLYGKFK